MVRLLPCNAARHSIPPRLGFAGVTNSFASTAYGFDLFQKPSFLGELQHSCSQRPAYKASTSGQQKGHIPLRNSIPRHLFPFLPPTSVLIGLPKSNVWGGWLKVDTLVVLNGASLPPTTPFPSCWGWPAHTNPGDPEWRWISFTRHNHKFCLHLRILPVVPCLHSGQGSFSSFSLRCSEKGSHHP